MRVLVQAFQIRFDGLGAAASAGGAGEAVPAGTAAAGVFSDLLAALQPGEAGEPVSVPQAPAVQSAQKPRPVVTVDPALVLDDAALLPDPAAVPLPLPVVPDAPVVPVSDGASGLPVVPATGAEVDVEPELDADGNPLVAMLQPVPPQTFVPPVQAAPAGLSSGLLGVVSDGPDRALVPVAPAVPQAAPVPDAGAGTANAPVVAPAGPADAAQTGAEAAPMLPEGGAGEGEPVEKVLTERPVPANPGGWETRVPEPGKDGNSRFLDAARDVAAAAFVTDAKGKDGAQPTAASQAANAEAANAARLALAATQSQVRTKNQTEAQSPVQAVPAAPDAAPVDGDNPLVARLAEAVADAFGKPKQDKPSSPVVEAAKSADATRGPAVATEALRNLSGQPTTVAAKVLAELDAKVKVIAGEGAVDATATDGAQVPMPQAAKPVAAQAQALPGTQPQGNAFTLDPDADSGELGVGAAGLADDPRAAAKADARPAGTAAEQAVARGTASADNGTPAQASQAGADARQQDLQPQPAAHDFSATDAFDDLTASTRTITGFLGTASAAHGMPGDSASAQSGSPMAQAAAAQVVAQMQSQARAGQSRFQIRLDPEELGRIDVEMTVNKDGEVKAKLTIDKAETLDMFMRDQRSLEKALEMAGLKADQGGLQFSLRDEGGRSFNFAGQDGQGRSGEQGARQPRADADAGQAERTQGERVAQLYRGGGASGLDIRI